MSKSSELITKELIDIYTIIESDEEIEIHKPVYINIEKDDSYSVTDYPATIHIENTKVVVCLWKEIKHMHVTVLK